MWTWETNLLHVLGKGGRPRACPFGRKAGLALDRYLRARAGYSEAARGDALWIGRHGAMGPWGIGQVVEARAREAGLGRVTPHIFRHTFAHQWLSEGGQ